ncbi:MAG: phosphatase PAP2 family protein [Acidimicrobiales bacterium]
MTDGTSADAGVRAPKPRGLRWWREFAYIIAFYAVYSFIRSAGSKNSAAAEATAQTNALDIIRWERLVGIYHEESIQDLFLGWEWFIRFWNIYYGSFHFVVTAGALVWLYRTRPDRYPLWRNTLAFTTGLALIGYAGYPLMPPRLLPSSFGYVDTLATIGGLWSFDSGPVASVSNQFAAMPSLHFGWAAWSAFVLWPAARSIALKALVVAYPLATLFAIVVTGNHFFLDAAGGAVVLAAGFGAGRALTKLLENRQKVA